MDEEKEEESPFPIRESNDDAKMKNINPSILLVFYGLSTEDPNTFLFEFEVLCRIYDFKINFDNLMLFPSNLKDFNLRWFVGLGGGSIGAWEEMKNTFLSKYKDYCKVGETRDEIFRMTQSPNETLEDYAKYFQFSDKRSTNYKFDN